MRPVLAARPDTRLVLAGGQADQVEAARKQAAAAGIGAATIFAGQRPAEEIPALPRRRRRAGVAAQPGHEYAAQDLSIPPIGPSHRRDAPADAHAGAGRRGRVPDRGDRGRIRRRDPRGAGRSGSRPRRRRARAPSRRNQVQLRSLPGAHAPGLRAPLRSTTARRPRPRPRTSRDRASPSRSVATIRATTATRSTPIRRWRSASTRCASADRSGG